MTASPRKENASRYSADSVKRGPKIRGPKTRCPHCNQDFFSRKLKSHHILLRHRSPSDEQG